MFLLTYAPINGEEKQITKKKEFDTLRTVKLQKLVVTDLFLSSTQFEELLTKNADSLLHLEVHNWQNFDIDFIEFIAKNLKKLQTLVLSNNTKIKFLSPPERYYFFSSSVFIEFSSALKNLTITNFSALTLLNIKAENLATFTLEACAKLGVINLAIPEACKVMRDKTEDNIGRRSLVSPVAKTNVNSLKIVILNNNQNKLLNTIKKQVSVKKNQLQEVQSVADNIPSFIKFRIDHNNSEYLIQLFNVSNPTQSLFLKNLLTENDYVILDTEGISLETLTFWQTVLPDNLDKNLIILLQPNSSITMTKIGELFSSATCLDQTDDKLWEKIMDYCMPNSDSIPAFSQRNK